MNSEYVTDTMAVILRLENRKLDRTVKDIFVAAENGEISIFISAMTLAEIGYLSEKNKIETHLMEVEEYCRNYPRIRIEPITEKIIHKSFEISDIPELHDRIIAGTAYYKNLEIITNDPMMIASNFVTTVHW